ncbi:hypothetical protein BX600DRAFT_469647 [Xylariales sp. PMI_506]|nr:hypothetical protein BX600DRAFT_469647 [Xylariales sp. PMI_506]
MYKPYPARPKKTNIVRNRTGCRTCRLRKKKCDETKPVCRACQRIGVECQGYAPRFEFRDATPSVAQDQSPPGEVNNVHHGSTTAATHELSYITTVAGGPGRSYRKIEDGPPGYNFLSPSPVSRHKERQSEHHLDEPDATDIEAPALKRRLTDANIGLVIPKLEPDDPVLRSPQSLFDNVVKTPSSVGNETPIPHSPPDRKHSFELTSPRRWNPGSSMEGQSNSKISEGHQSHEDESQADEWLQLSASSSPSNHIIFMLDTIYAHHLELHFNRILPNTMRPYLRRLPESGFLRSSILAVGAGSLYRFGTVGRGHQLQQSQHGFDTISPSLHKERSVRHYGDALKQIIAASAGPVSPELQEALLAAVLLLCYYELELGGFSGLRSHIRGANAIITSCFGGLSASQSGRDLLQLWSGFRSTHCTWKMPHHALEPEGQVSSSSSSSSSFGVGSSLAVRYSFRPSRTIAIAEILGEIIEARQRLVVSMCTQHTPDQRRHSNAGADADTIGEEDPGMQMLARLSSRLGFEVSDVDKAEVRRTWYHGESALLDLMGVCRRRLDDWHADLPFSSLPVDPFPRKSVTVGQQQDNSTLRPLLFSSSGAAMDFVYYALGCLLSDENCLRETLLTSNQASKPERDVGSPNLWVSVILRTIIGIDLESLEKPRMFPFNLQEILYFLALACNRESDLSFIVDVLFPRLEACARGTDWEWVQFNGRLVGLIAEQASRGRQVLHMLPRAERFVGPETMFDLKHKFQVLVHGRINGGGLFSDYVDIHAPLQKSA